MLDFAQPLIDAGQVLGYRDHQGCDRTYLLPQALVISATNGLSPAFSLFGYADDRDQGWQLSLQLRLQPFALPAALAEVPLTAALLPLTEARLRLRLAVAGGEQFSQWQTVQVTGDQLTAIALPLPSPTALQLVALLQQPDLPVEAVQIEGELAYQGLRPALEAQFSFQPQALHSFLSQQTSLLQNPEAALPRTTVLELHQHWLSTQSRLTAPAGLDTELALRLLELAWQGTPSGGYRLQPLADWTDWPPLTAEGSQPLELTWDLRQPVVETRTWQGTWQFSTFWQSLSPAQRTELVVRVPVPEPLKPTPIYLTNAVPLQPYQLKRIVVKLNYYGPSQSWENHEVVFERPDQVIATEWAILPHTADFFYYYSIEAYFDRPEQGGWPPRPIRLAQTRSDQPHLALTPALLNLEMVSLQAQADALVGVGKVEVQWSDDLAGGVAVPPVRSQFLTGMRSQVALLLEKISTPRLRYYSLWVHPPAGVTSPPVQTLGWTARQQGRILITSFHTQVTRPDFVRLRLVPSQAFPLAYLLLWLKPAWAAPSSEGQLIKLDPSQPETRWCLWRPSLFTPLAYSWRAELYFQTDAGLPPQAIPWTPAHTAELTFAALPEAP